MPLVLDGTNGVSGVDGTASNPSYEGTDSNTGIFYPAADTVAIGTGGTEALRVNSSQNVGVGTSSPVGRLGVVSTGGNSRLSIGDTASSTYSTLLMYGGSGKYNFQLGVQNLVNNAFEITPSTTVGGTTFSTPAFIINSDGNAGLGVTPSAAQGRLQLNGAGQTWFKFYDSTAGYNYGTFYKTNGTTGLGYIGAGGGNAISGGTVDDLAIRSEASIYFAAGGNNVRGLITSTGRLDLAESTASGAYIRSESFITLASNATVTITSSVAGAALICVYDRPSGVGGVFFANFFNAVTKIAGDGSATDTGTNFAVYKNTSSHTTTIRNRSGGSSTYAIAVYSADARV